jgi:VCBS repeat-containing protein
MRDFTAGELDWRPWVAPLDITTANLPNAFVNYPYSTTLTSSNGGGTPRTWSLVGGSLPLGLSLSSSGSISGTATSQSSNNFVVQLTDGIGQITQRSFGLQVNMANPPFAGNDGYSTNEDTTLALVAPGVIGNDFSQAVNPSGLTAVLVSSTSHGALTLNANGAFVYSPNANFNGFDSFTYRVSDGTQFSNIATVNIAVNGVNDAPIAANDSYATNEDVPLVVDASGFDGQQGLLFNDFDPDSANLTAVYAGTGLTNPAHGTLLPHANGSFTYTPDPDYFGPDSFTYRASDGALLSNIATVNIMVNPVNDAPIFGNGADVTVLENSGPQRIPNWASFSPGPPNESGQKPLAYHIVSNSNPGLFSDGPAISAAVGQLYATDGNARHLLQVDRTTGAGVIVGTINTSGTPPSLAVDPGTGTLFVGTGSGQALLYTLNPATAAATLVGDTGLGFAAIGGMDFSPTGVLYASVNIVGDGNTGGDHLAIIDKTSGMATVVGAFGTCSGGSSGTCTIEGIEGIAFDATGHLWGTHTARGPAGAPGLYTIDVATGTATFVASYLNAAEGPAPSGGIVALHFAPGGTLYGGTARAPSGTDGGRLVTIDKISGHFSYVGSTAATASGSSLAALAFVGDDATSGTLTFTPAPNASGSAVIGVTVQDDGGTLNGGSDTSATHTFTITVVPSNHAPVAFSDAYTLAVDTTLTVTSGVNGLLDNDVDADGNGLTAIYVSGPAHGVLDLHANGSFSYTPNAQFYGQDSFTYKANDGQLDSNEATVTLTINPPPAPVQHFSPTGPGTALVSYFNPAPTGDPYFIRGYGSLAAVSFFNPAAVPTQQPPPTQAAASFGVSFSNGPNPAPPAPAPTSSTAAALVSFANGPNPAPPTPAPASSTAAASVSFANGANPDLSGGTVESSGTRLDVVTVAAGPTITGISPKEVSASGPPPILQITGGNFSNVTSVSVDPSSRMIIRSIL